MIDRFSKGNDDATSGDFATDLGHPPDPARSYAWTVPDLTDQL